MKKRMSLQDKAEAALKKAVRKVVLEHKKQAALLRCGRMAGQSAFPLTRLGRKKQGGKYD